MNSPAGTQVCFSNARALIQLLAFVRHRRDVGRRADEVELALVHLLQIHAGRQLALIVRIDHHPPELGRLRRRGHATASHTSMTIAHSHLLSHLSPSIYNPGFSEAERLGL